MNDQDMPAVPEKRLSKFDPALKALNTMAEILDPFDRQTQLRMLAATCCILGMTDHANEFIRLSREATDAR